MKKGFTLIELLAVIVILAIIALIATPIVLNIINDTKESANLRSADFYLDALELSIAQGVLENKNINDGTYPIMSNGNLCLGTLETNTCTGDILEVEVNGETPTSGEIAITSGNISSVDINLGNDRILKNSNGELIYFPCELVKDNGEVGITSGDEYTCEVKPGTTYNFYVLNQETNGTTNLIMERNICEDGTLATEDNTCLVAWNANASSNIEGPVTAMDYVYNATYDWLNIPNMVMNYEDEGNTGSYGYGTIITTDNVTRMTKKDNTPIKVLTDKEGYKNLKARIPYFSEVSGNTAEYLLYYLEPYENRKNAIEGIDGYWTLGASGSFSSSVCGVRYNNYIGCSFYGINSLIGVRPVINIKL